LSGSRPSEPNTPAAASEKGIPAKVPSKARAKPATSPKARPAGEATAKPAAPDLSSERREIWGRDILLLHVERRCASSAAQIQAASKKAPSRARPKEPNQFQVKGLEFNILE
jgi:hypothetical protein